MKTVALTAVLLLFALPLSATELVLPDQKELGGKFFAVVPGASDSDPYKWPKRELARGEVTLKPNEELSFAPSSRLGERSPEMDKLLLHVQHLITHWGNGANNRLVSWLPRVPNLTTLVLCVPSCCGQVKIEELVTLKELKHLRRLALRMDRYPPEWLDYVAHPENIEYLSLDRWSGKAGDDLAYLHKFKNLKRLEFAKMPSIGRQRNREFNEYALTGAMLSQLSALKNLHSFAGNIREFTAEELSAVTSLGTLNLRMFGRDTPALSGLKEFSGVLHLELREPAAEDFTPLRAIQPHSILIEAVSELPPDACEIVGKLSGLNSLTLVRGVEVELEGWKHLAKLTNLRELTVDSHLSPGMKGFTGLEVLHAGRLRPEDLEVVGSLTSLRELRFSAYELKGAGSLQSLATLERLETLALSGTHSLEDEALVHLAKLKHLKSLQIGPNSFTDEAREAFVAEMEGVSLTIGRNKWR